ncbi:MAG: phosphoethanolamine--lipid A transferase [Sulfurimonas sp.]|uniref:phosphoethanolamine transferase n=1 Tax=Sulfurimonas sp. TaxID=2022749 RepID=UPI002607B363|nr:phosphoethanolamine--lipid A transferase [Sulfurimonas sp.]MDD5373939.1 phosphoethanolamine--lipid A transferase [Sulfurimonas sp.]
MYKKIQPITQYRLITVTALFLALFTNVSFFKNVMDIYPPTLANLPFLFSLFAVNTTIIVLLLSLLSSKYTTKPLLIVFLIVSALTNYFMNAYHIVIDESMIRNSVQTDLNESMDLLSFELMGYLLFLGILPSIAVYKFPVKFGSWRQEAILKLKITGISLGVIVLLLLIFSKFYTSFFREHKSLRYYANPTYPIYGTAKFITLTLGHGKKELKLLGRDAAIKPKSEKENASKKMKLVIMVVGEAARADRFSLNGYGRETNPLLKQEDIINFSNIHSCGTSTAVSVPCMFSIYNREEYTDSKGATTENVLDVLNHTGKIAILWRDNNSDSKGVGERILCEDFKNSTINTICDIEPRDEGMLIGLDKYIETNKDKDVLIVLHQMGNHGPAYYKRYPKSFEKFTPVCTTNQLENCSQEEISNAYDNAILYTDYFLSKVINFLKPYSNTHETAMVYMSDHGESLGENGLYLHGLPYFMAPKTQTHIASLMWFGGEITKEIDLKKLKSYSDNEFSHNNLFHTLLGIFGVSSSVYEKEKDILAPASIE